MRSFPVETCCLLLMWRNGVTTSRLIEKSTRFSQFKFKSQQCFKKSVVKFKVALNSLLEYVRHIQGSQIAFLIFFV